MVDENISRVASYCRPPLTTVPPHACPQERASLPVPTAMHRVVIASPTIREPSQQPTWTSNDMEIT